MVGVDTGVFFLCAPTATADPGTALPLRSCRFGEPSVHTGPTDCDRPPAWTHTVERWCGWGMGNVFVGVRRLVRSPFTMCLPTFFGLFCGLPFCGLPCREADVVFFGLPRCEL